jgi:hypothetical protein
MRAKSERRGTAGLCRILTVIAAALPVTVRFLRQHVANGAIKAEG